MDDPLFNILKMNLAMHDTDKLSGKDGPGTVILHSSLKFSCQWFIIMPTVLPDKSPGPAMWQQNAF